MKIRTLEVSELNRYIKNVLNDDPILNNIQVKGEVSNLVKHSSGNVYLSLKDENSKINCMIGYRNFDRNLNLENGSKVIAKGYVSSYERDGVYQLYITEISIDGIGDLFFKFNELKNRLSKEGLFDSRYKKKIPSFPESIGVVTSPTGAVFRDIVNVIGRRYPKVTIKLYPALVQGENSAKTLVDGIEFFNRENNVDTIIIGRGGGSLEELWSFNEEIVARAVFNSEIPVISAVGHETDFTICDFVSDLRAPTPSAAAELATPSLDELVKNQTSLIRRIGNAVNSKLDIEKQRTGHILEKYGVFIQKYFIDDRNIELDRYRERLENTVSNYMRNKNENLNKAGVRFEALNPFSVLVRGYCVAEKEGKVVMDAESLDIGDDIKLTLKNGKLECSVTDIYK